VDRKLKTPHKVFYDLWAGQDVRSEARGSRISALELARKELPDLILMNLSLPGIDDWTATRESKDDPNTSHIPILALTAHTLPSDRKHARESGFDGYISKPIDVVNFGDSITKILQNKQRSD